MSFHQFSATHSVLTNGFNMMRNKTLSFLKSAFSITLMSAAFCCWVILCVWGVRYLTNDSKSELNDSAAVAMATTTDATPQVKITNELRYTTMGWQTPSHWVPEQTQVSELSIAHFNPLLLASLILLASLLAILLDAPEEDVDRLLKTSNLKRSEVVAIKLNQLRE